MKKKGGYKIVNFKNNSLSGTEITLDAIYDSIVDGYNKAILVSGVVIDGELQDDAFANVSIAESGDIILGAYGGNITVTEDNEVTFEAVASNSELSEDIETIKESINNFNYIFMGGIAASSEGYVTTKSFNFSGGTRGLLMLTATTPANTGLYIVYTTSSIIALQAVKETGNVTLETSARTLTATATAGSATQLIFYGQGIIEEI